MSTALPVLVRQIPRYYRLLRLFRFFVHHPYIYASIFRDVVGKFFIRHDWVRPRNVVLKLDSKCNARCVFCYAQNDVKGSKERNGLEKWCSVIDQARELGCYTVTLSGGEPTINPDLPFLIRYATRKKMLAFTTTNGIAATPGLIDRLAGEGLAALSFSCHGPEAFHDRVVGVPGAYRNLVRSAAYAAKNPSLVCRVSHVLTRESARKGYYRDVWEVMKPLGIRTLSILPVCINSEDDTSLLDPQELDILDAFTENDFVSTDLKNYSVPLCPAAREDLFISDFGEVQPCPFIPISFGNVFEESMKEIFIRMQRHAMFAVQSGVCMPARDREFIARYIKPAIAQGDLPVRWDRL